MDTDAWATSIAAGSLVVAVVALGFSWRAVQHSKESNRIAAHALDMEGRREARHMEFRDVRWKLTIDRRTTAGKPLFSLRNVGTTDAHNVTLIFRVGDSDQSHFLSSAVPAGQSVRVNPRLMSGVERLLALAHLERGGVRVHWTSEAGEPGEWTSAGVQIE